MVLDRTIVGEAIPKSLHRVFPTKTIPTDIVLDNVLSNFL